MKQPIVREARMALNQFKEEIANELHMDLTAMPLTNDVTSRQAGQMGGKLGGEMTKRLIENASNGMVYGDDVLPQDLD